MPVKRLRKSLTAQFEEDLKAKETYAVAVATIATGTIIGAWLAATTIFLEQDTYFVPMLPTIGTGYKGQLNISKLNQETIIQLVELEYPACVAEAEKNLVYYFYSPDSQIDTAMLEIVKEAVEKYSDIKLVQVCTPLYTSPEAKQLCEVQSQTPLKDYETAEKYGLAVDPTKPKGKTTPLILINCRYARQGTLALVNPIIEQEDLNNLFCYISRQAKTSCQKNTSYEKIIGDFLENKKDDEKTQIIVGFDENLSQENALTYLSKLASTGLTYQNIAVGKYAVFNGTKKQIISATAYDFVEKICESKQNLGKVVDETSLKIQIFYSENTDEGMISGLEKMAKNISASFSKKPLITKHNISEWTSCEQEVFQQGFEKTPALAINGARLPDFTKNTIGQAICARNYEKDVCANFSTQTGQTADITLFYVSDQEPAFLAILVLKDDFGQKLDFRPININQMDEEEMGLASVYDIYKKGAPTTIINGHLIYTGNTPVETLREAVCGQLEQKPTACNQTG